MVGMLTLYKANIASIPRTTYHFPLSTGPAIKHEHHKCDHSVPGLNPLNVSWQETNVQREVIKYILVIHVIN